VEKVLQSEKTASPETAAKVSNLDNKVAELLRKVNKVGELSTKVDQLLNYVSSSRPAQPAGLPSASDDDDDVPMTKAEYKAYEAFKTKEVLKETQKASLQKAVDAYPELSDQGSEFYQMVDKYFAKNFAGEPNGPEEAAAFVAFKLGYNKKAAAEAVLNDDARRSRILSEGGTAARQTAPETPGTSGINENRLKNLLGVDPAKIKARMKADPVRYAPKKNR
jgi:Na+/phosphate symporter